MGTVPFIGGKWGVELWLASGGVERKLVFSGDLGYAEAPVMEDPSRIVEADLVLLESTYGDRNHRPVSGDARGARWNLRRGAQERRQRADSRLCRGPHARPAVLDGRASCGMGPRGLGVLLDSPMAIEAVRVEAAIHTMGSLSAHADQAGLLDWYGAFENRPPVCLVHGEPRAQQALAAELDARYDAEVRVTTPRCAFRRGVIACDCSPDAAVGPRGCWPLPAHLDHS